MGKKKSIETPFTMNLPTSTTIGAIPYTVIDEPRMEDFGDCNTDTKVIRINVRKHLTLQQLLVTWNHETDHAINEEYGLPDKERDVDRRAQGRTQVFKDWMEAQ